VSYGGSLQYSTGSYVFAERTHSLYLMSSLTARTSRFELGASIPLIFQNSLGVTYVGGTLVPTGGPDAGAVRQRQPGTTIPTRRMNGSGMGPGGGGGMGSGGLAMLPTEPVSAMDPVDPAADSVEFSRDLEAHVGDPMIHGSADLYSGFGVLRTLRVSAGAKAPVASVDSGVGTGQWDYSLGGSVMLSGGDVYLFGDLTWWWFGDLPGLELRDGPSYGFGAGRGVFGGRGSILLTLSGARSSVSTVDAPLLVGASLGYSFDSGRSLSLGLGAGLTESSPDFSLSLGWTVGL